jgi:hypothetical protein
MIIAARELSLRTANGHLSVPIRVFLPEFEKEGVWLCRYEIGWPDKKSESSMGGFDSTQALVLVLQAIGAEIYSSNYHKSGNLFWETPGKGYGFPVTSGVRGLLEGDDAKYL